MIIEIQRGPVVIIEPRGCIDTSGAKPFGDRFAEMVRAGSRNVLIDMEHTVYISSAGFRALLVAHKLVDNSEGKLVLCGISPRSSACSRSAASSICLPFMRRATKESHVIRNFLEQQGARWGARRDVMERGIFGTAQAVESIVVHCNPQGPINEYNLDVGISYQGDTFPIESLRPADSEIRDSEEGIRRLAGFMLQQTADRVRAASKDGRATLEFHYEH